MENVIYHIDGTTDELKDTLQREFGMNENAAKLFVFLSLSEKEDDIPEITEDKSALWYLNEEEKYTTPIFRTRFSISVKQPVIDLISFIAPIVTPILNGQKVSLLGVIVPSMIAVCRNVTYINKKECCVYYLALDWKKNNPSAEFFEAKEIMPKANENVCLHLEEIKAKKWNCDYYHEEECEATEGRFTMILDSLCEKNVFEKRDQLYGFKR